MTQIVPTFLLAGVLCGFAAPVFGSSQDAKIATDTSRRNATGHAHYSAPGIGRGFANVGDINGEFAIGFLEFDRDPGKTPGSGPTAEATTTVQEGLLPASALMTTIVSWLSTTFELPAIYDLPRVELVSSTKMAAIRYPGLIGDAETAVVSNRSMPLSLAHDLVAVYDDVTRTIYLPKGWIGATPAETSILVHEMVHHLQNLGNVKYDCPAARERPAYVAQNQWLRRFGKELEEEFEIDMFTVVVKSACTLN